MVRWGAADISKKANSEQRSAKEGSQYGKLLAKDVKIGKKLPSKCHAGIEIGASKKRFLV